MQDIAWVLEAPLCKWWATWSQRLGEPSEVAPSREVWALAKPAQGIPHPSCVKMWCLCHRIPTWTLWAGRGICGDGHSGSPFGSESRWQGGGGLDGARERRS